MRLFAAIKPDNKTLLTLENLKEQIKKQGIRGNYTVQSNLHITLAFIGEYPDPSKVLDVMKNVPFSRFSITVNGTGNFGELYYADVSVSENLKTYVKELRQALGDAGIPYDKKCFSPHITLLRRANRPVAAINVKPVEMKADRVILMRSDRTPSGMVYTPVGSVYKSE